MITIEITEIIDGTPAIPESITIQEVTPAGADGDSAYEIAVANGFVGTEVEWLASLEGTDGINGIDGEGFAIGTKETNTVTFEQDWVIGNAAPRTGNILFDFTGAKLGSTTMMIHLDAAPFTFPAQAVVLSGTASDTVANYIYFTLVNNTAASEKVHVTINQEVV